MVAVFLCLQSSNVAAPIKGRMKSFHYELLHVDKYSRARVGRLHTPRGTVDLPTFMPVGTLGTVKGLTTEQVKATGAQIVLGNTYHLSLRPGDELVAQLGGLHTFMDWDLSLIHISEPTRPY